MTFRKTKTGKQSSAIGRKLQLERVEDRCMLAIVWANEFDVGIDNPNFGSEYVENELIARALVNRAIDDWNAVIHDFNYDGDNNPATDNTFQLKVFADDIATLPGGEPGSRGRTTDGRADDGWH